jgi:cell division protein FtsL
VVLVLLLVVVVVVSVLMVVMVLQDARVLEVDLFHRGILCKNSPDTEMYRLLEGKVSKASRRSTVRRYSNSRS